MKICHVCKAECEDTAELCPVCGADLTGGESEEPAAEEIELQNPMLLASLEDVVLSEILRDLLHENGIPFTCDNEQQGAMRVMFGGTFVSDDIYVDESDFERATKIYEEFLASEPAFDENFFEESEESEEG